MAHTNRGRVILGGLLAGLVINIVEYITNGVVLREGWGRAMQALGKPTELSPGAIVIFNVWGFLLAGGSDGTRVLSSIGPGGALPPRVAVGFS